MSYVMVAAAVIGTGLQIGGKLGKNKDAQTAGGLVGLLGAAYGGASGMGGGAAAGGDGGAATNLFGMESAGGGPMGFDLFGAGGGGAAAGGTGGGLPIGDILKMAQMAPGGSSESNAESRTPPPQSWPPAQPLPMLQVEPISSSIPTQNSGSTYLDRLSGDQLSTSLEELIRKRNR